uniref:Testicular haploid expressed gene protein-like n=1 Tax=Stomoxys calcitrans TaxID=35570 RepID=A0A1I8P8Q6_STOCA
MWLKESSAGCCNIFQRLPEELQCFLPELYAELQRLQNLHRHSFVKNQRILNLAKTKNIKKTPRFVPICPCKFKKPIEVIHLDQKENTRTEQLAYPKARKLLVFKDEIKKLFPPNRIINLNRLIRKSLLSLYSRLANVQPPEEMQPIKKWDRAEWTKHLKKLRKLAKPKVAKPQPKIPNKRMPLQSMKRYKNLSRPVKRDVLEKPDWTLTHELKRYKATKRLMNLAKPLIRDTSMLYQELPIKIPQTVLKHKATKRTLDLSQPKARKTSPEISENPFAISPNALKAKASKRTKDLAEPKEYENTHIREDPFAISPAALKAKAKPRTLELAKPKK